MRGEKEIPPEVRRFSFSEEKKKTAYTPDDPRLDQAIALKATEKMIKEFSGILFGLDYVVMGSTAKYRLDKKREKRTGRAPGDFDAVVFSRDSFDRSIERLRNAGAVFVEADGETFVERSVDPIRRMPDGEAVVVRGFLPVKEGDETVRYEFEIFYKTRVVPDSLSRMKDEVFLNQEALLKQYRLNLEIENRVRDNITKVEAALVRYRDRMTEPEVLKEVAERLDLRAEEIEEFYRLYDEMLSSKSQIARKKYHNQIVSLLSGGFKEKVVDRLEKIRDLRGEEGSEEEDNIEAEAREAA